MASLGKIAVIVALVAGLAALGLTFVIKPKQDKLKADLATTTSSLDTTQKSLTSTKNDLGSTKKTLEDTKTELVTTKTDLATTKSDKEKAEAKFSEADKRAADLTQQVAERDAKLADIDKKIAEAGAPIEELKGKINELTQQVTVIEGEKKTLSEKVKQQEVELAQLMGKDGRVVLPTGLRGKILVYEKNWNFVVLNVGKRDGAIENGELTVFRNTKIVGRIRLTAVNTHLAIANILPQWSKMEIQEGDQVIPAS
ncbi:MAG: hypothetical protein EXS18_06775 [Verrucomicrobiae bacterium]|nr:hypothetical protein [Verrucomicrobiae bacterium]